MAQKVHLIGRDGNTYDHVELTQEPYELPRVIVDGNPGCEYVFVHEGDKDPNGEPVYVAVDAYWLRGSP